MASRHAESCPVLDDATTVDIRSSTQETGVGGGGGGAAEEEEADVAAAANKHIGIRASLMNSFPTRTSTRVVVV